MTDNQYKGFLLDALEEWMETRDLAVKEGAKETAAKAQQQIDKITEKLKF